MPQYHIEIDVPDAAPIKPVLGITYTPQQTSGTVGLGFQLSGLSKVTRCPRTYRIDGLAAPVDFSEEDAFCLDGTRLIQVSSLEQGGREVREYRTEIESDTKVWAIGDPTEGPEPFIAYVKKAENYTYIKSVQCLHSLISFNSFSV